VPWKPGATQVFIPTNLLDFAPPPIPQRAPLPPPCTTQNPSACGGLKRCCKAKEGKVIIIITVIIGETYSGDDNDNKFVKVSFQSYLSSFESNAGGRSKAGTLCGLGR